MAALVRVVAALVRAVAALVRVVAAPKKKEKEREKKMKGKEGRKARKHTSGVNHNPVRDKEDLFPRHSLLVYSEVA